MNNNARHCLMTLLWSSTDDDGEPLDSGKYQPSPELIFKVESDWNDFCSLLDAEGFDPAEELATMLHPDNEGDPWNAVAHDFVLTRNGHGVGFWDADRWHSPWGGRLTEIANRFGDLNAVADSDDGMIYC
jgi:hypothetical protein